MRKKFRKIRAKCMAWARFARILRTLRENQTEITKIKSMMPDGKLAHFTLIGGSAGVHQQYLNFYSTRLLDQGNESFPRYSRKLSQKTLSKLNI